MLLLYVKKCEIQVPVGLGESAYLVCLLSILYMCICVILTTARSQPHYIPGES